MFIHTVIHTLLFLGITLAENCSPPGSCSSKRAPTGYYNDYPGFIAALGFTPPVETFDTLPTFAPVTSSSTLGISFLTSLVECNAPWNYPVSATGGFGTVNNIVNNFGPPVLPGKGPIRFTACPSTIQAAGYQNVGGDDSTIMRFYDTSGNLIGTFDTVSNANAFNGAISDVPVAVVEIAAGSVGNQWFTVDNLTVAVDNSHTCGSLSLSSFEDPSCITTVNPCQGQCNIVFSGNTDPNNNVASMRTHDSGDVPVIPSGGAVNNLVINGDPIQVCNTNKQTFYSNGGSFVSAQSLGFSTTTLFYGNSRSLFRRSIQTRDASDLQSLASGSSDGSTIYVKSECSQYAYTHNGQWINVNNAPQCICFKTTYPTP